MKKLILIVTIATIFGCSKQDSVTEDRNIATSSILKYSVLEKNTGNIIMTKSYEINNDKVTKETYESNILPQYNYIRTFEYDNLNRLINAKINNQITSTIQWNGNIASVFNSINQLVAIYTFDNNQKLLEFTANNVITEYNYDLNDNVIAIKKDGEIVTEFLNYDTNLINPMSLIKSIGLLKTEFKPYFKNFFNIEKQYPSTGEDYISPLQNFIYVKTLDGTNRIFTIENQKTLIYTEKFEYL